MKKVLVYTDGACSGNPGVGGWGIVLIYNGCEKECAGYDKLTTNNRMELFAVIMGLKSLKEACEVEVNTDSAYVANAFNKNWIQKWQKNDWKSSGKGAVKNQDLWQMLLQELERHKVTFVKVKGHSDNKYNNRCDELAREQITLYKKSVETIDA